MTILTGDTKLTLTFGPVTATITNLQVGGYSRPPLSDQTDSTSRTLSNNVVISGSRNQSDFAWDLVFWATEETVLDLEDIHVLTKTSPDPQCTLVDLVSPVTDSATLTRVVAPAPNDAVTARASGNQTYFAQFKVVIVQIDTRSKIVGYQPDGTALWEVSLSLEEGEETI